MSLGLTKIQLFGKIYNGGVIMKIIYLSSLVQSMTGGPKYSVPKQISSQLKYDEVYWINVSSVTGLDESICEVITELDKIITRIDEIEPDLVIFEEVYFPKYIRIYKFLVKNKIKYIIIPRGCLTGYAQKRKRIKKMAANILLFNRFCKMASAIEFLSEGESSATGSKWNKRSIIIPNGVDEKSRFKESFLNNNSIVGVFIGRIEIIQKGIDLFLDACFKLADLIISKNAIFKFYGPIFKEDLDSLTKSIREHKLEKNILFCGEIYGEEKEKVLLEADLFFLTSRFEGMPMGLLDALSYGLPVLVTEGTNMGEAISETDSGLNSICDSDQIKDNLLQILNYSEQEFLKMSKNALELSKKYSWDRIAMNTHIEYEKIVK